MSGQDIRAGSYPAASFKRPTNPLLRLPAVGDNAAMQTDSPQHKRGRFQFSLRTLFVVATIIAVQCAVCLPMLREWQENDSSSIVERFLRVEQLYREMGMGDIPDSGPMVYPSNRYDYERMMRDLDPEKFKGKPPLPPAPK
jgi:hypothetical protein